MGKGNDSDHFKLDAVAQITERGYPVTEVSQRLGARNSRRCQPGTWFSVRFRSPRAAIANHQL